MARRALTTALFAVAAAATAQETAEDARKWFKRHLVKNASQPAAARLRWRAGAAIKDLVRNLTSVEPDPRLEYVLVRPWPGEAKTLEEGWPEEEDDRELAQWLRPETRTKESLLKFLASLRTDGGALIIRELERLPAARAWARRALKQTGRSLWAHDQVHVFHTERNGTGSYAWHYDLSDNLLFGLAGSKRFRVAGKRPHSALRLDATLSEDVAVYVPRKLFHNGVGLGNLSTLVSVALRPYTPGRERRRRRWRRRTTRWTRWLRDCGGGGVFSATTSAMLRSLLGSRSSHGGGNIGSNTPATDL